MRTALFWMIIGGLVFLGLGVGNQNLEAWARRASIFAGMLLIALATMAMILIRVLGWNLEE